MKLEFALWQVLVIHMRLHSGELPYKCAQPLPETR